MKRNFLQDVIPPAQRRSIRDIPIPNNKNARNSEIQKEDIKINKTPSTDDIKQPSTVDLRQQKETDNAPTYSSDTPTRPGDVEEKETETEYLFSEKPKKPKSRSNKKWYWYLLILIILFILFFVFRTKAEIIIFPKQESSFIQETFEISDKNNSDEQTGSLGYKLLAIQKDSTITVEPSGQEEVSEKASGTITIFNEYSSTPQKLVEKTRFETNKGLVYRIAESVTVPGSTEKDGKITAGQINVEVFADETGEKYNIGNTDFTIPGFKGLDQFTKMYAKSASEMSGGFVGIKKTVSEEDKTKALGDLKQKAKNLIVEEVNNSSEEYLIVFNEEDVEYSKLTENEKGGAVELKITANINAYVFDLKELARFIADKTIPNAPEGDVVITNIDQLDIQIVSTTSGEGDDVVTQAKLSIEGDVRLEWIIDTEKLAQTAQKTKRSDFKDTISSFKGISKAEVSLTPIWKNTFPKASKIKVLIQK